MYRVLSSLWLLMLIGCATPTVTNTIVQPDSPVAIPEVQPLTMNNVKWQVLTLDQLKDIVAQLQAAQDKKTVFFALDAHNYNNLSLNLIEIQRYIEEQKAILIMLKRIIGERGQAATGKTS